MIRFSLVLLLVAFSFSAQAQSSLGNYNGNNNVGYGNGTGNGNGNGNASNATINDNYRNTPTIVAPGLAAAGIETCLGSASVGGAAGGIGITIGGTFVDRGCELRLYSRALFAMGYRRAATQLLCNDAYVAHALAVEGVDCRTGTYYAAPVAQAPIPIDPRSRYIERHARRHPTSRRHTASQELQPRITAENK